jgi:dTDP-D-glucose 4,6-dehydratase
VDVLRNVMTLHHNSSSEHLLESNLVRHVLASHPDNRVVNLDNLANTGNRANLLDVASCAAAEDPVGYLEHDCG